MYEFRKAPHSLLFRSFMIHASCFIAVVRNFVKYWAKGGGTYFYLSPYLLASIGIEKGSHNSEFVKDSLYIRVLWQVFHLLSCELATGVGGPQLNDGQNIRARDTEPLRYSVHWWSEETLALSDKISKCTYLLN